MTAPTDDELTLAERHALAAWAPTPPPAGFAERVVAARPAPADATSARARRRRMAAWAVAAAVAGSLVAYGAFGTHAGTHASHGRLAPSARTTATLGDRGVAVAEPSADLRWDITPDGAVDVTQRAGDVFYRVDHGGPLVVHTPAGDIHVTGTCFRVEVPMNKASQMILAGAVGAAVATGVVITVYEGRVVADTRSAHTELLPGTRTVLAPHGHTLVAAAHAAYPDPVTRPPEPALDLEHATREQLVARLSEQAQELAKLRAHGGAGPGGGLLAFDSKSADGRPWFDPSADTLKAWAAECRVRSDEPDFDHPPLVGDSRGITADEMPEYRAAVADVQAQFRAVVRTLYIQATGDTAGADTLSLDAMTTEINDKAAPGAAQAVMQRVAQERAGLATPPADTSHASPVEQLIRAQLGLGDATQAAMAKRLGPDRAAAIRGDAWPRHKELAGCPDPQ